MVKTLNVDAELLEEHIQKSGYKLGYLIDQLGISRASYHKKMHGNVAFRASEVYVLCDLLNISEEEKSKIFCFKVDKNRD